MKRVFVFAILAMSMFVSIAQDGSAFGIKFSGFVKTDVFYDTRQSSAGLGIREGHFYLYPDNVVYDADSNDVNAIPSFHMLSIQTRLKGDITGPNAFGAKTSGVIEAEFFGTSNTDMNGFRLRHAYTKLNWTKTELLVGQTWHAMFPAEAFAGTLSFNTGVPFCPFSRNPQIKVTHDFGKIKSSIVLYSQRDFTSSGPIGASNIYLRNSSIPGTSLRFVIPTNDKFTVGVGADYKILRPRLVSDSGYIDATTTGSYGAFMWLKGKTKPITFSLMGTYAQNATDQMMIGGYAVSGISDTAKNFVTYTNITTAAVWLDITTNGPKIKFGLFGGFSKNMGADANIAGGIYGRGANIDQLMRISPRVLFIHEALTFGAEMEMTTAAYGTTQIDGTVNNTSNVTNIRLLLSAIYKF